jgi:hypothetical protein
MIITLASSFALLVTYFLAKINGNNSSQLAEPRSVLVTTGIQIICGDCSGEEDLPKKTYLDSFGNCSQCGGHSYILAANRVIYAQQLIAMRRLQQQAASTCCPSAHVYKETEPQWSLVSIATIA